MLKVKIFTYLGYIDFRTQLKRLLSVHTCEQYLSIQNDDGDTFKYPQIWLRDNCQCTKCFHQSSQSRAVQLIDIDLNIFAANVNVDKKNAKISIEWNDKHKSVYDLKWLLDRSFTRENREKYLSEFYRPKQVIWNQKEFSKILKKFYYDDVMNSNQVLSKWLENLSIYGIALIEQAPPDKSSIQNLANRVAFIKRTHYGNEFTVSAKAGAKNYAYLPSNLPLHTDLPYYEYKPGVNLLHCFVKSKSGGGINIFTDGFYVAYRLKIEYPEYFKILSETLVEWNDIGEEKGVYPFHSIFRAPVICIDDEGNLKRINFSIPQRDSHFSIELEKVTNWYKAYKTFTKMIFNEKIELLLNEGDLISFNNLRLLHGRTSYNDNSDNIRKIIGAYLDWDMIYARLRALKKST